MSVFGWGQVLRVAIALTLAGCLGTSVVVGVRYGPDLGLCGLLASIALLVSAVPIFAQRRYDICEPATVIALSVMIGASVRTLFLLLADAPEARAYLLLNRPPEVLLEASIYVTLGLAAYAAGYLHLSNRQTVQRLQFFVTHWQWDERRLLLLVVTLVVVSLVSMWWFYKQFAVLVLIETLGDFSSKRFGEVEGSATRTAYGYLRWGASLSGIALLFLTVSLADRRGRYVALKVLLLAVAGGAALVFAVFTSKRLELAVVLGGAAMAFLYVRRRIGAGVVTGLTIFMLSLFVAVTSLRSKAANLDEAAGGLTAPDVLATLVVDRHFIDVSKTALIQESFHRPDHFLYGSSFLVLFAAPVPRVWWPAKPSLQLGNLVGERTYGYRPGGTGVPPGMLGELWINFGWVMLLPGMFLMGVVLRYIYEIFDGFRSLPNGALLYVGSMIPLAWGLSNTNFAATMIDLATSLIPIVLGVVLISRPLRCGLLPSRAWLAAPRDR